MNIPKKSDALVASIDWPLAPHASLIERVTWLREYQEHIGNEKFLLFVASKEEFMSRRCKFFRKHIDDQD